MIPLVLFIWPRVRHELFVIHAAISRHDMNLRHDRPILDVEAMNCLVFEHGFHLAFWAYYIWLSQLRSFRFVFHFVWGFCLKSFLHSCLLIEALAAYSVFLDHFFMICLLPIAF